MTLSKEQTKLLIHMVATAGPDEIDCDECYSSFAEFVEQELLGKRQGNDLKKVEDHIDQCPCCGDEHRALLEALREAHS
ncbi:MAG: hypothetical protein AAFX06_07805 [Planctomycetota bacterium]